MRITVCRDLNAIEPSPIDHTQGFFFFFFGGVASTDGVGDFTRTQGFSHRMLISMLDVAHVRHALVAFSSFRQM